MKMAVLCCSIKLSLLPLAVDTGTADDISRIPMPRQRWILIICKWIDDFGENQCCVKQRLWSKKDVQRFFDVPNLL
jgi:hypothetical protein